MSINPSRVRRCALTLIYAAMENGGSYDDVNEDLFWSVALERDTDQYRQALAKAVLHTCRATADSARLLEQRTAAALEASHGDMTALPLRESLQRYANRTDEWEESLAALRAEVNNKRAVGTDDLYARSRSCLRLAQALLGLGQEMLPGFADFPAYRAVLEPLAAVVKRRARLLEACSGLGDRDYLAGKAEFAGMLRLMDDMAALRPAAEKLARNVLAKRERLEDELAGLLEHYDMGRLDMVDRSILLLALYELRVAGLTPAIVVSEATDLADTFSGTKSATFIHGVIGSAAKK